MTSTLHCSLSLITGSYRQLFIANNAAGEVWKHCCKFRFFTSKMKNLTKFVWRGLSFPRYRRMTWEMIGGISSYVAAAAIAATTTFMLQPPCVEGHSMVRQSPGLRLCRVLSVRAMRICPTPAAAPPFHKRLASKTACPLSINREG
jgi:hypothetical protein